MNKTLTILFVGICLAASPLYAQMLTRERPTIEQPAPDGPASVRRSDGSVLKIGDNGDIMIKSGSDDKYVTVPRKSAFAANIAAVQQELWNWKWSGLDIRF